MWTSAWMFAPEKMEIKVLLFLITPWSAVSAEPSLKASSWLVCVHIAEVSACQANMSLFSTGRGEIHLHWEVWEPALGDPAHQGPQQAHTHPDQGCSQGWAEGCEKCHWGWWVPSLLIMISTHPKIRELSISSLSSCSNPSLSLLWGDFIVLWLIPV